MKAAVAGGNDISQRRQVHRWHYCRRDEESRPRRNNHCQSLSRHCCSKIFPEQLCTWMS